ncbi:MAG: hypothetical protein ABSF67_12955 [Roseiarcus sp.]|jgi:hypothetical protein
MIGPVGSVWDFLRVFVCFGYDDGSSDDGAGGGGFGNYGNVRDKDKVADEIDNHIATLVIGSDGSIRSKR